MKTKASMRSLSEVDKVPLTGLSVLGETPKWSETHTSARKFINKT